MLGKDLSGGGQDLGKGLTDAPQSIANLDLASNNCSTQGIAEKLKGYNATANSEFPPEFFNAPPANLNLKTSPLIVGTGGAGGLAVPPSAAVIPPPPS